MKVLVTGGTGLVGTSLLPVLAREHELFATTRRPQPARDGVTWIDLDLSAPVDDDALPDRVDAIVHLAQSEHYRDFPGSASHVFAVNVASTQALLDYARRTEITCFVLASSGGIYDPGPEPRVESQVVEPTGFYGVTRYAAELLLGGYSGLFRPAIVRPFFVYGPRQSGMLISNLADRVLAGQEVTVQGTPGMRINPIYVDDAVRAIHRLLEGRESGVFNIAGDEVVGLGDLAQRLGEAAGVEARVVHSDDPGAGDLIADTTRMRDILGIVPATPLETGLPEVVDARRRAIG